MPKSRDLKIDRGIEVPSHQLRNQFATVIEQMQEGDSVFFDDLTEAKRFTVCLFNATAGTPFRQLMRTVEGGWRVWKVKR